MVDLAQIEADIRSSELEALEQYRHGTAPAPMLYRPMGHVLRRTDEADNRGSLVFIASEETPDRVGDLIAVDGWETQAFEANPVFLFAHDHRLPPIGTVPKLWKEGKTLLNTVRWDMEDPFAASIAGKYIRGIMRAESVGFRPIEFAEREDDGGKKGIHFTKQELLEISAVSVPMHPRALRKMLEQEHGESRYMIVVPQEAKEIYLAEAAQHQQAQAAQFAEMRDALVAVHGLISGVLPILTHLPSVFKAPVIETPTEADTQEDTETQLQELLAAFRAAREEAHG